MLDALSGSRSLFLVALLVVATPPAGATTCENLAKLTLPDISVASATIISAGHFTPPGSSATLETSQFCRVVAVARPTADSQITFEVWIPPRERWNGDFLGVGNGGYTGVISYAALANAMRRGFAAASTDTGHTEGEDLLFGVGHPEKIVDWGYRSIHVMTESAKVVIRNFQGQFAKRSYFYGCSTGGAQALSEAQRFPGDYDGLVAGAPGNDRVHINVGFLWAFAATHDANDNLILPSSKLPLITKAAVQACDELDGIRDGIISAPQSCRFNPEVLLCKGAEREQCLTADQVEAVRKVYAGPRNPRTGEQIIAGYSPGSESPTGDVFGGWKSYITDRQEPARLSFWRYWVFNNPDWDWHTFDYDQDVAYADAKMAAANANAPDLSVFKARGGKLLMYSGWADPIGPPMDAVDY
jgi:feruloyl esterase